MQIEKKGLRCPNCDRTGAMVTEARSTVYGKRRRYDCNWCDAKFSTAEVLVVPQKAGGIQASKEVMNALFPYLSQLSENLETLAKRIQKKVKNMQKWNDYE